MNKRVIWSDDMSLEALEWAREALNVLLDNDIVVIADLGLWNGRKPGYKVIESGNISDCLVDDSDYCEWYCDSNNLRCTAHYHDGTNHYLYRMFKVGLTERQKQTFLSKIYFGTVTPKDMTRYTKSIRPNIAKVFGW